VLVYIFIKIIHVKRRIERYSHRVMFSNCDLRHVNVNGGVKFHYSIGLTEGMIAE
jgi:hypothetical protein